LSQFQRLRRRYTRIISLGQGTKKRKKDKVIEGFIDKKRQIIRDEVQVKRENTGNNETERNKYR
jgi:hypothetical protein